MISEETHVKAIHLVNASLAAFVKKVNTEHLSQPTVQAAMKIWSGEQAPADVDSKAIESCDVAKNMYNVVVKEFVPLSAVIPVKVAIAHLKELKPALDEAYLLESYGADFCKKHKLVKGGNSDGLIGHVMRMAMGTAQAAQKPSATVAQPASSGVVPPSEKDVPVAPPASCAIAPPTGGVRHVPEPDSNGGVQGLLGLFGFFMVVFGVVALQVDIPSAAGSKRLPWVGRHNASEIVLTHYSAIEATHLRVLVSAKWRPIHADVNVTIESLTVDKVKYTRLKLFLSEPPALVAKAFQSYQRFDELHKKALPYYAGAELLLTPSNSVIAVLKASGAAILPLIPGVKTTFALVSSRNREVANLDELVIPSGTRMAAIISVNSAAEAVGTCSAPAPAAEPKPDAVVDMCNKVGQFLLPNSSVCSAAIKVAQSVKSLPYYLGKTHGATRSSALKMCKKSETCTKVVDAVFHQLANVGAFVSAVWSPPPVQTRVDAVYWFVPQRDGGTALIMVSRGINDYVAQWMALSYRTELKA